MANRTFSDERIREAARQCPTAAEVLRTLSPESFANEYYNTGSLFVIVEPLAIPSGSLRNIVENDQNKDVALSIMDLSGNATHYQWKRLVSLVHWHGSREYKLMHTSSGYAYSSTTFRRMNNGIYISGFDLQNLGLEVVIQGCGAPCKG